MADRLLEGADDLKAGAEEFKKGAKDVSRAATAASFWACSKPCIIIFGLLSMVVLYFLLK